MLITAALPILMLTVYLLKNFITLQTCKYTFSYSMYYYIINKYPQSCFTVLGLGTAFTMSSMVGNFNLNLFPSNYAFSVLLLSEIPLGHVKSNIRLLLLFSLGQVRREERWCFLSMQLTAAWHAYSNQLLKNSEELMLDS